MNSMKENTASIKKSSEQSALCSLQKEVIETVLFLSFIATTKKQQGICNEA